MRRLIKTCFLSAAIFSFLILLIFILNHAGLFNHLKLFNHGYRIAVLDEIVKGYKETGQILLRKTVDGQYSTNLWGDDPGYYLLLPPLVTLFKIQVESAVKLVSVIFVMLGYLLSSMGMHLLIKNKALRMKYHFYMIILGTFCLFILDVYIIAYFITSFIPFCIYFLKKKNIENSKLSIGVLTCAVGVLAGFANIVRIHSGTGMFLFVVLLFLLIRTAIIVKVLFISILSVSYMFPNLYLKYNISARDYWLKKHIPNIEVMSNDRHVVWHSLYCGLSFIPNKYGLIWLDSCSFNKATQIDSSLKFANYQIPEKYETIIKKEYINMVRSDPVFILKTYITKACYALLFLLLYFNLEIVVILKIIKADKMYIPFLTTFFFYLVPAILVWPFPMYFLGAINCCLFFFIFISSNQESFYWPLQNN